MLEKGPAKKLTIYVDEAEKFGGKPVYEVLLDIFSKRKIIGVSVYRGIAGIGGDGSFHTAKMLELSVNLPIKIEAVDTEETINRVLPDVYHVVEKGLVEISDTSIVKQSMLAQETMGEGTDVKLEGKAKMLRLVISGDDKWEGEPLHEALVKRFIMNDIAGATVYRAIAGYGPHMRYHKKKTLSSNDDLSVLIVVVDSAENIMKIIPILDEMVHEGIVLTSDVDVIKYTHKHEITDLA